jgi:hypothetical protein
MVKKCLLAVNETSKVLFCFPPKNAQEDFKKVGCSWEDEGAANFSKMK